jgi:hypothetical protein
LPTAVVVQNEANREGAYRFNADTDIGACASVAMERTCTSPLRVLLLWPLGIAFIVIKIWEVKTEHVPTFCPDANF